MTKSSVSRERRDLQPVLRFALFVVEIFALCLPALINRSPLVYPDTRAYFMGGQTAIMKIASMLPHADAAAGGSALMETVQKARGVRSAFYSLFTYGSAMTASLWAVVIIQALIVALLLGVLFRLVCDHRPRWQQTCFVIATSLFTTAAWATSNVMPDIFTAIMALSIALVVVFWQRMTLFTRWCMFTSIAVAVVMHLTNLPIGVGLMVLAALVVQPIWLGSRRYLVIAGAFSLGFLAMLAVGVVGFHQWTIAPQSPPFLTARSLQDGPGRFYLLKNCPQVGFEMCKHLDKLTQTTEKFIWDTDGVYTAVSPEEEARLRADDKKLYLDAAIAFPAMQIRAMTYNAFAQLFSFGFYEYYIPSWADYDATSLTLHLPGQAPWQRVLSVAEYVIVIGGLLFIVGQYRRTTLPARQFATMVIATVLLEAFAGAVSEPAPRYEARVIWLIPMTAALIWTASKGNRHA